MRNFYTPKQAEAHAKYHVENTIMLFLAILSDKYKFNEEKLVQLSKEVKFGTDSMMELRISRPELLDIIDKHMGR